MVDHTKLPVTDRLSDTTRETKDKTNEPNSDNQWEMIAYDDTQTTHSPKGGLIHKPSKLDPRQSPLTVYTDAHYQDTKEWLPMHQPDICHLVIVALI